MQTCQSSGGSPTSGFPYLRLYSSDKEDSPPRVQFHQCRWMHCDNKFLNMDDLVNHVNDQHVKVERPDVDYQCKWEGCPRRGKGFNARLVLLWGYILIMLYGLSVLVFHLYEKIVIPECQGFSTLRPKCFTNTFYYTLITVYVRSYEHGFLTL